MKKFILSVAGMLACVVVHGALAGLERYNFLEDAAVKQAKEWQKGGNARVILSTDGKLIFPFGQSMPTLTCTPLRACDIEMEPGEHVQKNFPVGDNVNWSVLSGVHQENGQTIEHVIFQPRDVNLETNTIIYTDRRAYHIRLKSPEKEGDYINRMAFYYPGQMVRNWTAPEVTHQTKEEKAMQNKQSDVLPAYTDPEKFDFGYRMEGNADFAPVRVFNDGERTYMEMPASLKVEENPILYLRDEQNQVMVTNYRVDTDDATGKIHYVVDKLFAIGELRINDTAVQIIWKKKEKGFWRRVGLGK